ncbi:MAG: PepSY domain-containing protein [Roseateles sp.]|uniref:PepSY domain-containing protein n=1 Tax=Roseateles sp. TaxID=1971397 RepID=UPI0040377914
MKRLATTVSLVACASAALAHGNISCATVPKAEKKPQMELQRKLEAEGWKVRQVKNFNNCYEVYGLDAQGKKAEVFFHPRTFERVYPEGEKPAAAVAQ